MCVVDVQGTRLEILEHSPLVIVSSHSNLLQLWVSMVSDVWCMRVFVCWLYALIECVCVCVCVGIYRQQHWTHWSTIHWWWSQVTYITYITGFESWVMCVVCMCVFVCVLIVCIKWIRVCVLGCTDNNIGDIGAQSIGDGLKSLTSLTELFLSGGWCVLCVFVCWLYASIECVCVCVCVGMYRQQHWGHWSTKHWWWSQITYITYKTGFG